ncbi:fumarylacetoacetate hydrolase family protein [Actinomadura madurae]|uniref:fumarylacetoacetate hydrolase family protein n=1 Tax=Actinomadura madurae TaxID=1993 RepID=UPI0015EEA838|nr:fumarylacetoacetate hydrolase family protein [Actinomadura madurae]
MRDFVGFLDHIRNGRRARGITDPLPSAWLTRPAFYFANPSALQHCREGVAITPGSTQFDFEFEVAVVVAENGIDIAPGEAGAYIAGYVLYCDWSARDIQIAEKTMGIGLGKAKDGAISLGPSMLSAAEANSRGIRVPDGLNITARVEINGRSVVQSSFTGMHWTFEDMIAYASAGCRLRAGDLIASGTVPGGCLLELSDRDDFPGWLSPGDVVRVDGGPLGDIVTTISAPPPEVWRRDGDFTRPMAGSQTP